jgi:uncharacterized repeat protein (TIGR03803 family)
MRLSFFRTCVLFACSIAIAACSQTTELSRFQYTPNVNAVRARGASTAGYNLLYSFKATPDGNNPDAGLIDVGGTLYGTTENGGKYCTGSIGCGTVFRLTTGGIEKVLHSFGKEGDGAYPSSALINVSGTLYGTTIFGGAYGYGTIFSITTGGAEKVVYSFRGQPDGSNPVASLIDVGGTLYGTTAQGGKYCASGGCGTVFSITTGGTEKVLHNFGTGTDGFLPSAQLTNVKGTLYGTTLEGGAYTCNASPPECGTVFSVTKGGKEKVLHSFGKGADGKDPSAGLTNVGGTLYSTTRKGGAYYCSGSPTGCGTVFSITTSGTEKVLHSFGNGTDGSYAPTGLIDVGGTLYGTTGYGGKYCTGAFGCGTVFSITTGGMEKVLHSFGAGSDGIFPVGLTDVNGTLYGTTAEGGAQGYGTVFTLTP